MVQIVKPDAEDVLARTRDRRQQRHILKRRCGVDGKPPFNPVKTILHGPEARLAGIDQIQHAARQRFATSLSQSRDIDDQPFDQNAQTCRSFHIGTIGYKFHVSHFTG